MKRLIIILSILINIQYAECVNYHRYVDAASAGGDGTTAALSGANAAYASLQACNAAEKTDLTKNGGNSIYIHCGGSTADTTPVSIATGANWITSSTNTINIIGNWASGYWDTTKYRMDTGATAARTFDMNKGNIYISSFQATNNINYRIVGVTAVDTVGDVIKMHHFILKGNTKGTFGIGENSNGVALKINNGILYNFTGNGTGINQAGGVTAYYDNLTFFNCSTGTVRTAGTPILRNCAFYKCDTAALGTYGAGTSSNTTNNASMGYIVTGGAVGDRLSQTFSWKSTTETSADFLHLCSSDTAAVGHGLDLSADANDPFSTDIDYQARTVPWDIGADQHMTSGGGRGMPHIFIFQSE